MIRTLKRCTGLLILVSAFAAGAAAQEARLPLPQQLPSENAGMTREQISRILSQYPPELIEVLQLDRSLLTNKEFLQPYPQLAVFLAQHPEILRNPAFFLGERSFERRNDSNDGNAANVVRNIMETLMFLVIFGTISGAIIWLIKAVIDDRRWSRMWKVQVDAHSRLMDRFTTSEALLAYIQTPSGQRFLESTPIAVHGAARIGAPIGRILWSVQAGLIVGFAGLGMRFVSRGFENEFWRPFYVLGVLGIALGIGFVVSSLVAYFISRNLGLLNRPETGETAGPPT
jgi:hypothetical protein